MEHASALLPIYMHVLYMEPNVFMLHAEQEFLFIHSATNKTSVDHCSGHGFWLHGWMSGAWRQSSVTKTHKKSIVQ